MNAEFEQKIDELSALVTRSKHAVLFGGAGMSTESGLADFRSAVSGLYNKKEFFGYPAEQILSREFFDKYPEIMFNFYRTELLNLDARPNLAHFALAWMEERGLLSAIITQNADSLHQRAGSKKVYDLHGNVYKNTCLKCGKSHDVRRVKYCDGIPYCECGGIIRPGIVFFGETPDVNIIFGCVKEVSQCDLLIAAGTSMKVSSAARLIDRYKGTLVILNNDETAFDSRADLIIRGKIGEIFSALWERLIKYERDTSRNREPLSGVSEENTCSL